MKSRASCFIFFVVYAYTKCGRVVDCGEWKLKKKMCEKEENRKKKRKKNDKVGIRVGVLFAN